MTAWRESGDMGGAVTEREEKSRADHCNVLKAQL